MSSPHILLRRPSSMATKSSRLQRWRERFKRKPWFNCVLFKFSLFLACLIDVFVFYFYEHSRQSPSLLQGSFIYDYVCFLLCLFLHENYRAVNRVLKFERLRENRSLILGSKPKEMSRATISRRTFLLPCMMHTDEAPHALRLLRCSITTHLKPSLIFV